LRQNQKQINMKCKLLLSMFFACCFSFAFAQETTSEIQGIVKNGSAAVAGTSVQAVHTPTGTVYTTTTRKDGRYNLSNDNVAKNGW
jgi:hypothetical protein